MTSDTCFVGRGKEIERLRRAYDDRRHLLIVGSPRTVLWIGIATAEGERNRQSIAYARDGLIFGAAATELGRDSGFGPSQQNAETLKL
jgi:hypothetical protein